MAIAGAILVLAGLVLIFARHRRVSARVANPTEEVEGKQRSAWSRLLCLKPGDRFILNDQCLIVRCCMRMDAPSSTLPRFRFVLESLRDTVLLDVQTYSRIHPDAWILRRADYRGDMPTKGENDVIMYDGREFCATLWGIRHLYAVPDQNGLLGVIQYCCAYSKSADPEELLEIEECEGQLRAYCGTALDMSSIRVLS